MVQELLTLTMDNVEEPPNRIQQVKHTLITGVPCCIKGQERVCIQHLKVTYAIDLPLGGHHLPPMGLSMAGPMNF